MGLWEQSSAADGVFVKSFKSAERRIFYINLKW